MATFGYETLGSSEYGASSVRGRLFTLPVNGTVSKLTLGLRSSGGTYYVKGAIYSEDGNTLYGAATNAVTVSSTTAAFYDATFTTPVSLSAGNYILCCLGDNAFVTQRYNTSDSGTITQTDCTYANFPAATVTPSTGTQWFSIYATYTGMMR